MSFKILIIFFKKKTLISKQINKYYNRSKMPFKIIFTIELY